MDKHKRDPPIPSYDIHQLARTSLCPSLYACKSSFPKDGHLDKGEFLKYFDATVADMEKCLHLTPTTM